MTQLASNLPLPEGIVGHQIAERPGVRTALASLSVLILGGILVLALSGLLGGAAARPMVLVRPEATLRVDTPRTLRNGLFFETRITVTARSSIADATLAVAPGLWKDMTINSQIPAAQSEDFGHGGFRFHYGPLGPGDTLAIKIDGQINPPLFAGTRGWIALDDGDRRLGTLPVAVTVLP